MTNNNELNNYAFIDGANLHKGIAELGWKLDYKRFRVFLKQKYDINKAYLFLGFISKNSRMYKDLQDWGYTIVFKPTVPNGKGEVKGNTDAEFVLQAVSDFYEKKYNQAILVTGDGDFACLADFLKNKNSLKIILSPNHKKCSILLKQHPLFTITFLSDLGFKDKLEYRKR